MPQYLLARHVFVCLQGEHVVFLDVRKDRYFALEATRTVGVSEHVAGWPVSLPDLSASVRQTANGGVSSTARAVDREALSAVLSLLLEKEILTTVAVDGKTAEPVRPPPLGSDLAAEALDEPVKISAVAFLRFVSAAIRAALILRYRSFDSAVARVKARIDAAHGGERAVEIERLHYLVGVFSMLRPFFFTSKDACLFDALALSEFLAGYEIYPRWIFAVQARPFAAHCWLQLGDVVLNDTVDHVRRYTPIMVV
jgi:hypothetical protein